MSAGPAKKLAAYWDWPSGAPVPDARIVVCAPDWGGQPVSEQCDGEAMKVIRAARDGQIIVFPSKARPCVPWPLLSAWPAREGVVYVPALHVRTQADLARLPDLLAVQALRRALVVSPEEAIDLEPLECQYHGRVRAVIGDDGATPFCSECPGGEESTELSYCNLLEEIDVVFIVGLDKPMCPDWVRAIVAQCRAASVPVVLVAWGPWAPAAHLAERYPNAHIGARFEHGEWFWRVGAECSGAMLDGEAVEDVPAWLGGAG